MTMFKEKQVASLEYFIAYGQDVFIDSFPHLRKKDKIYYRGNLVELHRLYLEDVYEDMKIHIKELGIDSYFKLINN